MVPLIFFAFFFFGLIVFLLNEKSIHQHNRYFSLVIIFRYGVYIFLIMLVGLSIKSIKKGPDFIQKEKDAIADLKQKIGRFVRDE